MSWTIWRRSARKIHEKLVAGVEKRLIADAKVGFLLSGGLDSSLVCAIAARKSKNPIRTFAIGMSEDAIDLKYAKQVADYIGSDHTEVIITKEDVLAALERRDRSCWAPMTSPPSAPAWACTWSARPSTRHTDIRVLLTGEISDELFGYKYTDFAPQRRKPSRRKPQKRIRELHMYDVLRADRCISVNSLEARVPFGDLDFVAIRHVHRPGEEDEPSTARANTCSAMRSKATTCPMTFFIGKRPPSPMPWVTPWWTT